MNIDQQGNFKKLENEMACVIYEIEPLCAPYHMYQSKVLDQVKQLTDIPEFAETIFEKVKILSRYSYNDPNENSIKQLSEMNADEKLELIKKQAFPYVVKAAKSLIDNSGIDPSMISNIVGLTTTVVTAPSFDVEIINELGLSNGIKRTMINNMGCSAAINSLRTAAALAKSVPNTYVMVVGLEASTISLSIDWNLKSDLLNQCLFTDGSVALLVTCQERSKLQGKFEILDDFSYLVKKSQDVLTVYPGTNGTFVDLRHGLPIAIEEHIKIAFQQFLNSKNLTINDLDFIACHPGGPKILSAVYQGLEIPIEFLGDSYDVMKRYGNMIGVATYYVLNRVHTKNKLLLKEGSRPYNYGIALAFSPGASIEAILLKYIN